MSINRSGYYAWRKRRGKHQKHKCYGYHNLAEKIREETGWVFSDNLAHKCCKYAGVRSLARKTYHPTKGKEHIKYGNIVAGNWNANEPMQIVVSDMTMLKTKYCKWEWTFAVDTFNNEIIASSVSRKIGDTRTYIEVAKQVADKAKEQTRPTQSFSTQTKALFTLRKLSLMLIHIVPILYAQCQEWERQQIILLLRLSMVGLKKNCELTLIFITAMMFLHLSKTT